MAKRLDRSLFLEVALPFVAAQAVFVVVFIGTEALTQATKLISEFGLPAWGVIKLLFLRIPWAIGWTMPMSVGMAVILALGRLCHDTEYTPMVIGGMSFRRLMAPILVFATLVSVVALAIEECVGPAAQMAYYSGVESLKGQVSATQFEVHHRIHTRDSRQRVTVNAAWLDIPTRTLSDVDIHATENGVERFRLHCLRAVYQPAEQRWLLLDGFTQAWQDDTVVTHTFDRSYVEEEANQAGCVAGLLFGEPPGALSIYSTNKPDYLTCGAIRRRLAWMASSNFKAPEINSVRIYLHERWTLAASCLVFALVGAPLAVRPQRGASIGSAFALGLGLVLVYYIVWNATCQLGKASNVPWLWAWSTNVVGALVGLALWRGVTD